MAMRYTVGALQLTKGKLATMTATTVGKPPWVFIIP